MVGTRKSRRTTRRRLPAAGKRSFNITRSRVGRIKQPVQYFKRVKYSEASVIQNAPGITYGVMTFSLAEVPNYTEFTNLYDQYKIMGVKVKIVPRFNSVDLVATQGGLWNTQMISVLDYDDATAPTSIDELCQYQNMKMTPASKIHSRYLAPRCNTRLTDGFTNTNSAQRSWVDCGSPTLLHHGIKYAITDAPNVENLIKYDVYKTYYLAFKNVR